MKIYQEILTPQAETPFVENEIDISIPIHPKQTFAVVITQGRRLLGQLILPFDMPLITSMRNIASFTRPSSNTPSQGKDNYTDGKASIFDVTRRRLAGYNNEGQIITQFDYTLVPTEQPYLPGNLQLPPKEAVDEEEEENEEDSDEDEEGQRFKQFNEKGRLKQKENKRLQSDFKQVNQSPTILSYQTVVQKKNQQNRFIEGYQEFEFPLLLDDIWGLKAAKLVQQREKDKREKEQKQRIREREQQRQQQKERMNQRTIEKEIQTDKEKEQQKGLDTNSKNEIKVMIKDTEKSIGSEQQSVDNNTDQNKKEIQNESNKQIDYRKDQQKDKVKLAKKDKDKQYSSSSNQDEQSIPLSSIEQVRLARIFLQSQRNKILAQFSIHCAETHRGEYGRLANSLHRRSDTVISFIDNKK
ncbi:MAG: hypothetical protein EZS28_005175 [Streblomastix strix]|uniref:Uncharacterized protein n=1 Tax=Streblomastix strix TaxID=222440 RepID=A0A5J4WWI5_9EUKA|nr:MAG: hypothetical protein EZS28_005175 [Streblomastix strix]